MKGRYLWRMVFSTFANGAIFYNICVQHEVAGALSALANGPYEKRVVCCSECSQAFLAKSTTDASV